MTAFDRLNETLKNIVGNVIGCFLADHPELGTIRCNCELISNDGDDEESPPILDVVQTLGEDSETERIAMIALAVAGRMLLDGAHDRDDEKAIKGLISMERALDIYSVATGGRTGRPDADNVNPRELAATACRVALGLKDTAVRLIDKAQGTTAA